MSEAVRCVPWPEEEDSEHLLSRAEADAQKLKRFFRVPEATPANDEGREAE